jgi:hypothetical protein
MSGFSKADITRLLADLDTELTELGAEAELYLVGGAVMTLVFDARPATKDIDALFKPQEIVRKAARRVALRHDLSEGWLNDAAKGYLSANGDFSSFLELPHLRVYVPGARYLFAMKALAMRIGPEFADEDDVRFLGRWLNIGSAAEAVAIMGEYYPLERFPPKSFLAIEEIFNR